MKIIVTQYNRTTTVNNVVRTQYSKSQNETLYVTLSGGELKTFEDVTFIITEI